MRNLTHYLPARRPYVSLAVVLVSSQILCGSGSAGEPAEYPSFAEMVGESGKNPGKTVTIIPPREPEWRISAGAVWRDIGDVRFDTGSYSQRLSLPNLVGHEFRQLPSSAGQPGELGLRQYQSGFVSTDAGTATDGLTWNWGYQEASQVQGDQLVYTLNEGSQRTMSRSTNLRDGSWQEDSEFEPGPYIEIDRLYPLSQKLLIGPQFNFSFINVDQENSTSTFSQNQRSELRRFTLTDRFDLDGIIPPLAPYEGTEEGPGPVISNYPGDRRISSSHSASQTADFFNRVDESFDLDLFTFGAGAHVEYDHGPVFIQASAGLALNIADWEASHRETLYVSRNGGKAKKYRSWSAHESDTDVLVGAYVQGKLGVQLTERLSVAGFARYDWNESLTGNVGPSSFDVDLDGLSAGVVVGFTF